EDAQGEEAEALQRAVAHQGAAVRAAVGVGVQLFVALRADGGDDEFGFDHPRPRARGAGAAGDERLEAARADLLAAVHLGGGVRERFLARLAFHGWPPRGWPAPFPAAGDSGPLLGRLPNMLHRTRTRPPMVSTD